PDYSIIHENDGRKIYNFHSDWLRKDFGSNYTTVYEVAESWDSANFNHRRQSLIGEPSQVREDLKTKHNQLVGEFNHLLIRPESEFGKDGKRTKEAKIVELKKDITEVASKIDKKLADELSKVQEKNQELIQSPGNSSPTEIQSQLEQSQSLLKQAHMDSAISVDNTNDKKGNVLAPYLIGGTGKTTLAKEIQHLSDEKFLFVGIDTLFGAIPKKLVGFSEKTEKEGFRYVVDPKTGVCIDMKVSLYAIQVFSCLPKVVKLLADNGLNVIFDECNFYKELLDNYRIIFSGHKFFMVSVKCDLETLEKREKLRGDRVIGMAKVFYQSEKNFQYPYDLVVDNTTKLPSTNAKKILELLKN
ncbi:23190_t:CDS:2, partial [Entrophospora sp. SA101]